MENLSGYPQHGMKSEERHISSNIFMNKQGGVEARMARPEPWVLANWTHDAPHPQHGMADQGLRPFPLLMPVPATTTQQHVSSSANVASIHMPALPSHPEPGNSSICPSDNGCCSWRKYGQQAIPPGWGFPMMYCERAQTSSVVKKSVAPSGDGQIAETVINHNHPFPSERWQRDGPAGFEPRSQDYMLLPEVSAAGTSVPRMGDGGGKLPSSSDSEEDEDEDDDEDEARLDVDVASNANAMERMFNRSAPAPAQRITAKITSEPGALDGNLRRSANCHQSERRRSKSKVWEEFNAVLSGGKVQSAECKHCKKFLSGKSSGGTSHLRRHLKICPACPGKSRVQQGQSSSHPETYVEKNPKFDQDKSLELLAKALVSNFCSFTLTSNINFSQFLAGICPTYDMVSQHAFGEKFLSIFQNEKMKLKEEIALAPGGVFLAVASWGLQTIQFICVTVHFIDKEWKMNRKIIRSSCSGDETCDPEYYLSLFPDWQSYSKRKAYFNTLTDNDNGAATAILKEAAQDWSLEKKILGIAMPESLGGAATLDLEKNLVGQNYLLAKFKLLTLPCIVGMLHNLFSYDINEFVLQISRDFFHYMTCSPLRREKYKEIISQLHLNRPSFGSQRWHLIYYLLEAALQFNKAFPNPEQMDSLSYPSKPSCRVLEAAENFCNLVRPIYHAIKVVTSRHNATLNTHFHVIWSLRIALWCSSTKVNIDQVLNIKAMQMKFDSLWSKWYLWLSLAVILDPRYKFRFLDFCFKQAFGSDAKRYILEVRGKLYELFLQYSCYVDQQNCEHFNQRNNDLQLDTHGSVPVHDNCKNYFEQSAHELGELIGYLEGALIPQNINFDILRWWKDNASMYPTLVRLARDILAIPGSVVSAESAFDETDERVSLFNRKLSPEVVEALICTQDWIKSSEIK